MKAGMPTSYQLSPAGGRLPCEYQVFPGSRKKGNVRTVGLCHSWQKNADSLLSAASNTPLRRDKGLGRAVTSPVGESVSSLSVSEGRPGRILLPGVEDSCYLDSGGAACMRLSWSPCDPSL